MLHVIYCKQTRSLLTILLASQIDRYKRTEVTEIVSDSDFGRYKLRSLYINSFDCILSSHSRILVKEYAFLSKTNSILIKGSVIHTMLQGNQKY